LYSTVHKSLLRVSNDQDSEYVLKFVSKMLVNEFKITLKDDELDFDLLDIKNHHNKED
jgi:hypothetical protein